jgi:hypothetical protein
MSALANVIPIKRQQKNRLAVAAEPRLPEPAALYALVVLTFVTHVSYVNADTCVQCQTAWPCEQARRAYRLREGF